MPCLPPADELAQIRDDLRRLKIREAVLRRAVLDDPSLREGTQARVVVRVQKRREIVLAQLPSEIVKDGRYWRIEDTPLLLIEHHGGTR